MAKRNEEIEAITGGEFLDEEEARVEARTIPSGQGAVSGRRPRWKGKDSEPEIVCGPHGRLGWRVKVPGSRPLATPAVFDGRLFLGGGFGSHEFYAFDAETGRLSWSLRTKDDGPTAATLLNGYVAFNTESCTVYVVDAASGRVVWERWLGDPLMAQPALWESTLFMTYPDSHRRHFLSAFDLETGEPRWKTELIADVMSAPVVAEDSVYATTLEGSVYRIDRERGRVHWSTPLRATSAPWIHRGRVFLSLREEEERGPERFTSEGYDTVSMRAGRRSSEKASSRRRAEYLKFREEAAEQKLYAKQDAMVGFATAPLAAKLHMAKDQIGLGHVRSVWSYQGSRPEVFDDGIFTVQGDAVQRLDLDTKKPLWRTRLEIENKDVYGRLLNPPAVTSSRLYVTSALGDLLVLDRKTGDELWALNVGSPVPSQPSVAGGKVFFGTSDGRVYAFETDDPDPAGWPMWGGGPGHNGPSSN